MKRFLWLVGLCVWFSGCGDGETGGANDDGNHSGNGGNSASENNENTGEVENGGTENGGTENGGTENGGTENGGSENGHEGGGQSVAVEGMPCGSGVCDVGSVCIKGACVARNNTVELEGTKCNETTFAESCDGNSVVYCGQTVDAEGNTVWQVAVSDCGSAKCALRARANFGFCVVDEPRCTKETAGRMTYCRLEQDLEGNTVTGGTSFIYYYDCDQATDGHYYAFRDMNNRSDECPAGCLGDACSSTGERCQQATYPERCEGTVHYYCSKEGTEERFECADYGTTCVEGEDLCAWE